MHPRSRRPDGAPTAVKAVLHTVLAVALVVVPAAAAGPAAEPLSMAAAVDLALEAPPEVAVRRSRAEALREEAEASDELPDPQLRFAFANLPTDSFALGQEPMTQVQLGLRQSLPDRRGRQASRSRLLAMADAQDSMAEDDRRRIRRAVREDWLDVYLWEQTAGTIEESRVLFAQLVEATRARYAAGARNQHDLIRAELELTRLDDRLLAAREQEGAARARLSEWIGDAAARPLDPALPALPRTARQDLRTHPMLSAVRDRIQAASAGVRSAEAAYRPDFAVELGLGFRGGRDVTGAERPDFLSLGFSMDLPLFADRRQDRRLAAAHLNREAAVAELEEVRRRLNADLDELRSRLDRTSERETLFRDDILPRTRDQARAALDAYRADQGDFAEVMRAHVAILDTELERLRLEVELERLKARLAYLEGDDHA